MRDAVHRHRGLLPADHADLLIECYRDVMRRRWLSLVVVPALALADPPRFDTLVSVRLDDDNTELDTAFYQALASASGRLDACWHKSGHLRATVGLDAGKVTSVDITRIEDNRAKDCIAERLGAVELGGAMGLSVVEVELEAHPRVEKIALLSDNPKNRKVLDAILKSNLSTNLGKFTGVGVGTGADQPPVDGDLSSEAINRVMRAHAGVFRACYQKELNRDPKLAGKVVMRFTINPDGATTNVALVTTTLKSPAVETCLARQIERLKFPAKTLANVTYPFLFGQGG